MVYVSWRPSCRWVSTHGIRLPTETRMTTRRCPVRTSVSTPSFLYSKRRNSESNLAHVHEQSEFTNSGSLIAAGHL